MNVISNVFSFVHPDSVILDKLGMTCPQSENDRQHMQTAAKDPAWLDLWARPKKKYYLKTDIPISERYKAYWYQSKYYWNAIDLLFDDTTFEHENVLTLEFGPRYPKTMAYMKIEYNPALIAYPEIEYCLQNVIPGGVQRVFEEGDVCRIDVAMDIKDVRPAQIILDYANFRYRTPPLVSGRLSTLYIGKDTGEKQLYAYDKARQMADKKYKIKPMSDYQFPKHGMTRIEMRLRPDPAPKFMELHNLPNPFEGMIIAATPLYIKEDDYFQALRDLCVLKGMRHAFKGFSAAQKNYFANRVCAPESAQ